MSENNLTLRKHNFQPTIIIIIIYHVSTIDFCCST